VTFSYSSHPIFSCNRSDLVNSYSDMKQHALQNIPYIFTAKLKYRSPAITVVLALKSRLPLGTLPLKSSNSLFSLNISTKQKTCSNEFYCNL
jgi:hypothetical protein